MEKRRLGLVGCFQNVDLYSKNEEGRLIGRPGTDVIRSVLFKRSPWLLCKKMEWRGANWERVIIPKIHPWRVLYGLLQICFSFSLCKLMSWRSSDRSLSTSCRETDLRDPRGACGPDPPAVATAPGAGTGTRRWRRLRQSARTPFLHHCFMAAGFEETRFTSKGRVAASEEGSSLRVRGSVCGSLVS